MCRLVLYSGECMCCGIKSEAHKAIGICRTNGKLYKSCSVVNKVKSLQMSSRGKAGVDSYVALGVMLESKHDVVKLIGGMTICTTCTRRISDAVCQFILENEYSHAVTCANHSIDSETGTPPRGPNYAMESDLGEYIATNPICILGSLFSRDSESFDSDANDHGIASTENIVSPFGRQVEYNVEYDDDSSIAMQSAMYIERYNEYRGTFMNLIYYDVTSRTERFDYKYMCEYGSIKPYFGLNEYDDFCIDGGRYYTSHTSNVINPNISTRRENVEWSDSLSCDVFPFETFISGTMSSNLQGIDVYEYHPRPFSHTLLVYIDLHDIIDELDFFTI